MAAYILRRLLLIIPTLFGILVINFAIIQVAPGGPVEQMIAQITGSDAGATARLGGGTGGDMGTAGRQAEIAGQGSGADVKYRGAQGLDPALIARIEKQFGFDKPAPERFWIMVRDYATFNFGDSFFKGRPVIDLILDKLPVSVTLGLWTTLIVYLVSIPLGIRKAVRDGTKFDTWTSAAIIVGYAIPGFLFAVLLIVLFAGGSYWDIFPLRGLTSDNWDDLTWIGKIGDYFWHITLPVVAMTIGGFASLTMLTKNSFLDEINKQYVMTARAKGLTEHRVLYGHVFRNAMLIVIAGFPAAFVSILFTNSLLIEYIFSLDGLGLLSFEALIQRDYPIMFGSLYVFTLIGLLMKLIGDLTYVWVDPRIDFETREVG
jgi:microcin C transport system permease protein